jgi:hypothetical protein
MKKNKLRKRYGYNKEIDKKERFNNQQGVI